mgnify:CR=1 FL=1
MNFVLCISAMVYACVAICVFRFAYNVNEDLKQRKHYKKHPERYGVMPVWAIAIISILWPLQIIGLLIYLFGGYKR